MYVPFWSYGFFIFNSFPFRPTNAVGNDGAAAVVSITKVADINSKITPVEPETEPCTTCNRYPHPVGAVNKLDPKLQLSFPLRCTSTTTNATRKSTRIVTYGRTITSEEILQQIKVNSGAKFTYTHNDRRNIYIFKTPQL